MVHQKKTCTGRTFLLPNISFRTFTKTFPFLNTKKKRIFFFHEDVRNLSVKQLKIPLDLANRSSVTEKDDESRQIINCTRRQSPICNFNHQLTEGNSVAKCTYCKFKIHMRQLTIVQIINELTFTRNGPHSTILKCGPIDDLSNSTFPFIW